MSTAIYYFSGTGNSLSVARDIAAAIGGNLYPIAQMVELDRIRPDAPVIGIVFPVYYGELPVIIKRFATKLEGLEDKYVFAVCTFGGSEGYSLKILRRIIRSRGGELTATYRVHLPQNSFAKPWESHAKLYANWRRKTARLAQNTAQRKRGEFFRNYFLVPFFGVVDYIVNQMRGSYRKSFIKISGASPELSTDELIHLNDMSYAADENCHGCGLCARVCPVANIEIVEQRPVWRHHCENCLACYNWCPTRAIHGGIAHVGFYYRHPEIKVSEIMRQQKEIPPAATA